MSLDANEISAVFTRDPRVSRFEVARSVPVIRRLLGEVDPPKGRVNLSTVIDIGEKWLRAALWGEWLAVQDRATITQQQKNASGAAILKMLDAVELRAKALRRCLYDTPWAEFTLQGLLLADGEAKRLYEAKQLTTSDLLRLEPGVFILLVASKGSS